jgi:hypothetical protein
MIGRTISEGELPGITSVVVDLGVHTDTSVVAAVVPGSPLYMYRVVSVTAHICKSHNYEQIYHTSVLHHINTFTIKYFIKVKQ